MTQKTSTKNCVRHTLSTVLHIYSHIPHFLSFPLPLLVSTHNNYCHDKEANIHNENHHHWHNERQNKVSVGVQPAAASTRKINSGPCSKQNMTCTLKGIAKRPFRKHTPSRILKTNVCVINIIQHVHTCAYLGLDKRKTELTLCQWCSLYIHNYPPSQVEQSPAEYRGPCTAQGHLGKT